MISKLIDFSLKQRLFIVLTTILAAFLGFLAYKNLPIDVFPDPSPPLVQVYTESEGMPRRKLKPSSPIRSNLPCSACPG